MSQVFYRKWRPQSLAEVVGQEAVTRTLANALASGRVAHAYLFTGPRGTGKTSTGRILAKALNCLQNGRGDPCNQCSMCQAITQGQALDLIEIDAASNRGIDEIRELREKVQFAPNLARYKVYIIDEVHMLTPPAFNALLKTLEEPPLHTIFVLATTEPHKVPATIVSRCQHFDFRRLSQRAIVTRLRQVSEAEGLQVEEAALSLIARSAAGSLRDAENLLEQLMTYYGQTISLEQARALLGLTGGARVGEFARELLRKDISAGLVTINRVREDGLDLRQFNRELVDYLRALMLLKSGMMEGLELTSEEVEEARILVSGVPLEELWCLVKLFGSLDLRLETHPTLPLEMALVEYAQAGPAQIEKEALATPSAKVEVSPREKVESVPAPALPSRLAALASDPASLLQRLQADWRRLLAGVPENLRKENAIALLRSSCAPLAIEGNALVLGFKYPLHKEQLEKPENKRVAEEALSALLGAPYKIRCIHNPQLEKPKATSPSGPLVEEALKMGARLVEEEGI